MGDSICPQCLKVLGKTRRLFNCQYCNKTFHASCTKVVKVKDTEDNTLLICTSCSSDNRTLFTVITDDVMRTRSNSQSSNASVASFESRANTPLSITDCHKSSSGASSLGTLDPFQDALLRKIDALSQGFGTLQTSVNASNASIEKLEKRCAPLDHLPQLITRVDVLESEIENIKKENKSLRELITQQNTERKNASTSTDHEKKLLALQKELKEKLDKLDSRQSSSSSRSTGLVISGLDNGTGNNYSLIALAVLQTLRPTLTANDIISARPMRPKKTVSATTNTDASSSGPTPDTGTVRKNTATKNYFLLAVTLMTPTLVQALVHEKIKIKVPKSSSLNRDLLTQAGCVGEIPESNININELLEGEAWRLKKKVLENRKNDQGKLYSTFTSQGRIYVKKNKEDTPTLITSEDDLETFLGTI